jgi:integrase
MKRALPPYVYLKKGKLYFQRRGYDTVRLFSKYGSAEFDLELARAKSGRAETPISKRSFHVLIENYRCSTRFENLSPRSKSDYVKILEFFRDRFGDLNPVKMQRKDVIRLRDTNGDKVRFANYCVQIIRILFEHAIDLGWRSDNPAKGVQLIKSKAKPREAWPAAMIQKYRETATGRELLLFELCIGSGQRIGDVLKMQWSDIEDGGIHVQQNKTGQKLWLPFTPQLADLLSKTPKTSLFLLSNKQGTGAWSYRGASHAVRQIRTGIGALDYDIHGLRHTATSELAALGLSDELIMSITGHKSASMISHYSGASRQKARALMAQKKRTGTEREC